MCLDDYLQAIAHGYLKAYIEQEQLYNQQVAGLCVFGVYLMAVGCLGIVAPVVRKKTIFIVVSCYNEMIAFNLNCCIIYVRELINI